jgi:thiamine biosynthesis lipoprotein
MGHPDQTTRAWKSADKRVSQEIMKTNILCEVLSNINTEPEMLVSLEEAFSIFRDFADHYSRFSRDNDLFRFNESEGGRVSEELFQLLEEAKHYHEVTGGLFDPSILLSLEREGYVGAYSDMIATETPPPFSELILDRKTLTATKPLSLKIDLGGIGKGFVADKVAFFLRKKYRNFLVDAGGDIFVSGTNQKENYPYWAISVEHPLQPEHPAALLVLSDMAVATSGRNRKRWTKDGSERHHLIDPSHQRSAASTLLSVTVIAESVTRADVFAKTLFIAGQERGSILADTLGIPALFIDQDGSITSNRFIEPYVWKK